MYVNTLDINHRRRFINNMNRKWQKKYEAHKTWLEEFDE